MKCIIEKWYKKLNFPQEFDSEFYSALTNPNVAESIDDYDVNCQDGIKNLLSFLYFCEKTERLYKEKGISDEILADTLNDIVLWAKVWSKIKGGLYLGELAWLKRHLEGRLFKLGRLQFEMNSARADASDYGIKKGDNIIAIHIPRNGRLDKKLVDDSINNAKLFFARYFPEYKYSYMTCHSWLLDESLKKYLSPDSNILSFADRFDNVAYDEKNDIMRFIFGWDVTGKNLSQAHPPISNLNRYSYARVNMGYK